VSTRIAVTTIVRSADLDVPAGWLRVLSTDGWEQVAMAPLPDAVHRARDPNPRGGLRGGRGIASTGDRLAVAINDRILVLGRDWALTRVLSHRWMGGIHDIAADSNGIWVSCADNDIVLHLDWDGRLLGLWQWRADRRMRRALGFGWLPKLDRRVDHRDPFGGGLRVDLSHVNAVALDGDALLVGLGLLHPHVQLLWPTLRERLRRVAVGLRLGAPAERAVERWRGSAGGRLTSRALHSDLTDVTPGSLPFTRGVAAAPGSTWAIVELRPSTAARPRAQIVAREPAGAMPSHNVAVAGGLVVVNDTARARVVALERETGALVHSVQLAGELPFPRGLVRLDDGRFVVGTQNPAALNVVDLAAERVDSRIELQDDRGESPYAIAQVPEGFGDPALLPSTRSAWGIPGGDASPAAASEGFAAATS
jgi:hypothetical protein